MTALVIIYSFLLVLGAIVLMNQGQCVSGGINLIHLGAIGALYFYYSPLSSCIFISFLALQNVFFSMQIKNIQSVFTNAIILVVSLLVIMANK